MDEVDALTHLLDLELVTYCLASTPTYEALSLYAYDV